MTNTFALTDFDLYDDTGYDDFLRRKRRGRRRVRKFTKPRLKRRPYRRYPTLGRPPLYTKPILKKPKVIRGIPTKLPPIKPRLGFPPNKRLSVHPIPKVTVKHPVKKPTASTIKTKTPIHHLIKKTNPKLVKKSLTPSSKQVVNKLKPEQVAASKKAIQSDNKTGKMVKIIAAVGVVGITGFGIYKYTQLKKKQWIY